MIIGFGERFLEATIHSALIAFFESRTVDLNMFFSVVSGQILLTKLSMAIPIILLLEFFITFTHFVHRATRLQTDQLLGFK